MTVLVVGNATLDLSFEVFRLPRPGETLLADDRRVDAGGKGLNQALVAHRCGVSVRFLAPIGDDADGSLLRKRLEAEALPTHPTRLEVGLSVLRTDRLNIRQY